MNIITAKKYIERRIYPENVDPDTLAILLTEMSFRGLFIRLVEVTILYIQILCKFKEIRTTVGACQARYGYWKTWCSQNDQSFFCSVWRLECNYLVCKSIIREISPQNDKQLLFGYNGYPNRHYRERFFAYRVQLKRLKNTGHF